MNERSELNNFKGCLPSGLRVIFFGTALISEQVRKHLSETAYVEGAQFGRVSRSIQTTSWVLERFGNKQIKNAIKRGLDDHKDGYRPLDALKDFQESQIIEKVEGTEDSFSVRFINKKELEN